MDSLSASNGSFTLDLFKKLNESFKGKNIFFSPWSISSALAMTYVGAKGNTATQMAEVLHFKKTTGTGENVISKFIVSFLKESEDCKAEDIHSEFQALISLINKPQTSYLLKTANRLYEEQTFQFHSTKTKPVQMMFLKDTFPICYLETMKVKIAELPYVNNDLSMLILLPDDIEDKSTGLEQVKPLYHIWTSPEMMKTTGVELFLPRIKLEESYNLKSTLSSMGMKDAFSQSQADFKGMSEHNDLFLSQVFHKSFVEVNEEGTEAAAASAVVVVVRSSLNHVRFKADHPFLFFIRHNKTNSILFFGRFCSP
uniref:Serpin B10 n=1 Tax=Chrysemys picta bellii TaxID=8478 RepID=A0A8C3HBK5_CHRPI